MEKEEGERERERERERRRGAKEKGRGMNRCETERVAREKASRAYISRPHHSYCVSNACPLTCVQQRVRLHLHIFTSCFQWFPVDEFSAEGGVQFGRPTHNFRFCRSLLSEFAYVAELMCKLYHYWHIYVPRRGTFCQPHLGPWLGDGTLTCPRLYPHLCMHLYDSRPWCCVHPSTDCFGVGSRAWSHSTPHRYLVSGRL